jgi:ribosomal protein S27AE
MSRRQKYVTFQGGHVVAEQRFCPGCGGGLVATAAMCPRCGTPTGSPHSKGAALLLAIFLSFWTWLYTYKRDGWKFWTGMLFAIAGAILSVVLIGVPVIAAVWLWAIIDRAVKPESFYQNYPNE